MTARYEVHDHVAVIALDNPPVNALGIATRKGIVEAIDRAQADPGVAAIVIMGSGRGFSGGADIREFNTPKMGAPPALATVLQVIEQSAKPVVAALHGVVLGGGLELALAAHYRVAAPGTQLGLPEVKLGLLPGAGGTQRLPRAVGLEEALNMIVSGAVVPAERLVHTRLLNRLSDADLRTSAIAFAGEVAAHGGPHPRIRDATIEHANAEGFLEFARSTVAAAAGRNPAPLKCLEAIEAAVQKPFEEGLRVERQAFQALLATTESRALRHAFFAERASAKVPGIGAGIEPRRIGKVAVIGAGTMGGGISMSFLNARIPVTLIEAQPEALARGVATLQANYESSAKKGKLTRQQIEERLALLHETLDYEEVREADLIVEAVFEDYETKETVFGKLDAVAKPGAILATNTSTLDLDRIAAFTRRPRDVVGMHFFSPAHVMTLLEVVRGAKTAPEVLCTAMSIAGKIGKTAVLSGVCDGFIGNRMIERYLRQAQFLLEEGALPQQVDRALEQFGFAMGPFRMSDLAGNDIGWAIRKRHRRERPDIQYPRILDSICEHGRFGQKSGAGWYDYEPGDRTARPSAKVEALILEHSRSLGLTRRTINDEEIAGRLVYALINEGARILEEGIAVRASDIDVVYLNGYGFPRWRGGPMFYADTVGLYNVVRAMRRYAEGYHGEEWVPSPRLLQLADAGEVFNS